MLGNLAGHAVHVRIESQVPADITDITGKVLVVTLRAKRAVVPFHVHIRYPHNALRGLGYRAGKSDTPGFDGATKAFPCGTLCWQKRPRSLDTAPLFGVANLSRGLRDT